jgi:hypothetical protein
MCPLGVTDIAITRLIQLGNTKRKTLPRFYPYFYIPPTPLDLNKGERNALTEIDGYNAAYHIIRVN